MNSFNHYAYGAVIDWLYEKAAGIRHAEDAPGFAALCFEPHPCREIGFLNAELETRNGTVRTSWRYEDDLVEIALETPVRALAILPSGTKELKPGMYSFRERYE